MTNERFDDYPDDWLPEASETLVRNWGVPVEALDGPSDWDRVLHALTERVGYLLTHRPEKLATAMYLLDISEAEFAKALDQPSHADRAHALALAILHRETQKIRTRRAYASGRLERKTGGD
ncbi:MAG: hypothetical protein GC168_12205 [Candidatus Hydrogenedens sp.]|nr:hypothetical protein [Candidatus Hydrogenedens sp.]